AEWDSCTDPQWMLALLSDRDSRVRRSVSGCFRLASDRKLRLFACACCRAVWHLLAEPSSLAAVRVAERYAGREATWEELDWAGRMARGAVDVPAKHKRQAGAAMWCCTPYAGMAVRNAPSLSGVPPAAQAALIREILDNPFRPPLSVDPAWLAWNDGAVRKI